MNGNLQLKTNRILTEHSKKCVVNNQIALPAMKKKSMIWMKGKSKYLRFQNLNNLRVKRVGEIVGCFVDVWHRVVRVVKKYKCEFQINQLYIVI